MITMHQLTEFDGTILLCPDRNCTLFTKPNVLCPCERNCPHQEKLKKIVMCGCGELVVLSGNHSCLCRVDHNCNDGMTRCTFVRMNGKYRRVFEMPVK